MVIILRSAELRPQPVLPLPLSCSSELPQEWGLHVILPALPSPTGSGESPDSGSDKYRVIAAYEVACVLEGLPVHCEVLLLASLLGRKGALQELLGHSLTVRNVLTHVLPVAAHETNANIVQECLKVLQCGARHCMS